MRKKQLNEGRKNHLRDSFIQVLKYFLPFVTVCLEKLSVEDATAQTHCLLVVLWFYIDFQVFCSQSVVYFFLYIIWGIYLRTQRTMFDSG